MLVKDPDISLYFIVNLRYSSRNWRFSKREQFPVDLLHNTYLTQLLILLQINLHQLPRVLEALGSYQQQAQELRFSLVESRTQRL